MNYCDSVNEGNKELKMEWKYEGCYENRLRRSKWEREWVNEMIEKDRWKYIM
jgi:hypothetical protein|tara:strand:+ start:88 stop:243 length:156 start_codon:yes stop_codon:yes gene_type:complete